MWRRVSILLAAGLVALSLGWLLPQREPRYQGKTLSDWIVAMHQGKRPQREEARAAVHQLAPKSLPLLIKWLQQPDHASLQARLGRVRFKTLTWLERRKLLRPRPRPATIDWKQSYRFLAVDAFSELGPEAQPAIPQLIHLLSVREGPTEEVSDTAGFAYVVLRQLAPTSIPALVSALTNSDEQVWTLAAEALGDIGPEANAALPALRQKLALPAPELKLEAADAMSKLGAAPDEFMPAVVDTLREPKLEDLDEQIALLLEHKDHAQDAVPLLRQLLTQLSQPGASTNLPAACSVSNALVELSPEAGSNRPPAYPRDQAQ